MDFGSEEQLRQKAGLESWRNLSKEKFLAFVSELPNMDKEVALKVIGQFPEFKRLVLDSYSSLQEQTDSAFKANWKSQKKVHKAYADTRRILERELERENLTSEERLEIVRMIGETADKEFTKDSENKAFVVKIVGVSVGVLVMGMAAGNAVLGGKSKIG